MSNDTNHNGWTNYETWRVNLEMIDADYWRERLVDDEGDDPSCVDVYELGDIIKEYCIEILDSEGSTGLCLDYALAFIGNVNFKEIAAHIIADFIADRETA
jgi:hypothetical protein